MQNKETHPQTYGMQLLIHILILKGGVSETLNSWN